MREVRDIQDVNIALRELYEFYDLFKRNSVDLNGKRFTNVGKHVNDTDFVRWDELTDEIGGLSETVRKPVAVAGVDKDKATFGLQKLFAVGTHLTLNYICVRGGRFKYVKARVKDATTMPVGQDAILDILLSIDDGITWNTILAAPKLVLPSTGVDSLVTVSNFVIGSISPFDLLRIDCLQIGTTYAGRNYEVVTKWE